MKDLVSNMHFFYKSEISYLPEILHTDQCHDVIFSISISLIYSYID